MSEPTKSRNWVEQNAKDIGADMFKPDNELKMASKLLPCPFCGNSPKNYEGGDYVVNHASDCVLGLARNNLNHWIVGMKTIQRWQNQSAAKQLEAVTKERDEANTKNFYNSFIEIKLQQSKTEVELSTLKSDYKQALEALSDLMGQMPSEYNDGFNRKPSSKHHIGWQAARNADKVLSLPSAIAIMKGDKV